MIRLRQITGADSGRVLEFNQDLIRIGRMPDSDVNFDPEVDLDASGRHAEIRNEDGRYLLIDTGSRNGTWLNGQRIKHAALKTGDEIEFGRGGPQIEIASVRNRPSSRAPTGRVSTGAPPRDPRFDPLAMPVTTATRLEDLTGSNPISSENLGLVGAMGKPSTQRGRRRTSVVLWGAAGLLVLAAVAIVLVAFLR